MNNISARQAKILARLQAGEITVAEAERLLLAKTPKQHISENDVAIVGMACRFAGANSWQELWDNLQAGADSIIEVPEGRWPDASEWYHPDPDHPDTSHIRHGGFLQQVDQFDAAFFQISPAEAKVMDPQQRIFLEEAYSAILDAGYAPDALRGSRCGVFVAATRSDYDIVLDKADKLGSRFTVTGLDPSALAARITYFLDLHGAAMAIDTACSSSLTAIHRGCESIRNGESEMALAGGVSLWLTPTTFIQNSQFQLLSADAKTRSFDAEGSGFAQAEGCGVLLLKKATDAIRDGDHIYALIKGSGINQNGSTNGFTAPSLRSQKALQTSVYQTASIDPATVEYVEAHGTASVLGDSIEVAALSETFKRHDNQSCALGAIKSNIGNSVMAAGVAGVIKSALCLKFETLVPTLHFNRPNPEIDFPNSPFYVNTQRKSWDAPLDHPRRAAVNAYGISGTNAHLILESAPVDTPAHKPIPHTFNRERFWADPVEKRTIATALRPLIDRKMRLPQQTVFEMQLSEEKLPYLRGHLVYGKTFIPGAFYVATVLSSAELLLNGSPCSLNDVIFPQPLTLYPNTPQTVQVAIRPENQRGERPFQLGSFDAKSAEIDPLTHAEGNLTTAIVPSDVSLAERRAQCINELDPNDHYDGFAALNIDLIGAFRWLTEAWEDDAGRVLAHLEQPDEITTTDGYVLHPTLLDACFQLVTVRASGDDTHLPFTLASFTLYHAPASHRSLWCAVENVEGNQWNIDLFAEDGEQIAAIRRFEVRKASTATFDDAPKRRSAPPVQQQTSLITELRGLAPMQRTAQLLTFVKRELADVLEFDSAEKLDSQQGFFDMGVDSLMLIDLRNRLQLALDEKLPPTLLFKYTTPDALVGYLTETFFERKSAELKPAQPIHKKEVQPLNLDELSDEEAEALLLEELAELM